MYEYRVLKVARVIDGDTYDLDLDLGFHTTLRVRIRCMDVDTYELYGRNAHPKGREAREFAARWLDDALIDGWLTIRTAKLNPNSPVGDGSFGRWAGQLINSHGVLLADALTVAGMVKP